MSKPAVRILVALENPAMEDSLVRLAATLAREPWGELHLTHVVTPDDPPLADAQSALDRAAALAVEMGVVAIPHLLHGETVTIAIQEALRRWSCDVLIMGWYGDVDPTTVLSSPNRALTKALDVDTLIFKDKGFGGIRRLLVPTGGGTHSMMGLEVAHQLAQVWQAKMRAVRIARVPTCRADDPLQQRYCHQVADDMRMQLNLLSIARDVESEVIPAQEVVAPIIDMSHDDDLLILGASNDWRQEDFLAGSIPDEIAYKAPCSVLMVRSRNPGNHHLSNIFWEHTIRLDLHPRDKWEAIDQMVDVLIEEKQVPPSQRDVVLAAACEREHKSSTAIGRETAVPHAPLPGLPGIIGALAVCPDGVDFSGQNGADVHYIFLLLTPQQNYRTYIPILAQIAALMHTDETRSAILNCETPAELTALIKNQERASPS
jgi:mannitol/fructose-specific phosphotransferase system IIA component (Ntr-type)/nucleotide-binding universal stress UspA family protein